MPARISSAQSAASTAVSIIPQSTTAYLGQDLSVNIGVSDAIDLFAWEVKLSWNASSLHTVAVVEGPFLKSWGDTYFTYVSNDTSGHMTLDCSLLGQILGVDGDGVLATVTFFVSGVGETPLDLYEEVLLNHIEAQIPSQVSDGYCYLSAQHDVSIFDVEATPLATSIGNPVNINVTAQNTGAFDETFSVTVYANSEAVGMQPVSLSSGSSASLLFIWDTVDYEKGDYIITASASLVPEEVNVLNNNKQAANPITLLYVGHDLAVIQVEPYKTIVGQGYSGTIKVLVKNYGTFIETSNSTVFANATIVWLQVDELTSGASAVVAVNWSTSSFTRGNFTIGAYAQLVPDEAFAEDNYNVSIVPVHVGVPGDISGAVPGVYDGAVNMRDIAYIIAVFNTRASSPSWKPNADINNDGIVNMRDIAIAILNFNRHE